MGKLLLRQKMREIETLPKKHFSLCHNGQTQKSSFIYLLRNLSHENTRKNKNEIDTNIRASIQQQKHRLKNCQSTKSCRKSTECLIVLWEAMTEKACTAKFYIFQSRSNSDNKQLQLKKKQAGNLNSSIHKARKYFDAYKLTPCVLNDNVKISVYLCTECAEQIKQTQEQQIDIYSDL